MNYDSAYPMMVPALFEDGVPVESTYVTGINLRQHYAGAALVALIGQGQNTSAYWGPKGMAAKAVEYADALIAELGK